MNDRMLAVTLGLALLAPTFVSEARADDYLDPVGRLPAEAKRAKPLTDAEVDALVASIPKQPLASGPLDPGQIAKALGPGFVHMRSTLATAKPVFEVVATTDRGDFTERTLELRDPFVGTVKAILLLPKTKKPSPAILALPGHGDSAETFRDEHHTADWASSGDEPYHCESVPGLFPLHRLLDDVSTSSVPVKSVPYGFGRSKLLGIDELEIGSLVAFFDQHLGSKPFAVPGGDGSKY